MWTVLYLPEAEGEVVYCLPWRRPLSSTLIASCKLWARSCLTPTRAPSRERTGFASFDRAAERRLSQIEGGMTVTKLSNLKSADQIAAEELRDRGVSAEFERTGVAEQVAVLLTTYRVEHGLTQNGLAKLLGMHQPAVARLEAGAHEPSLATLARLSRALGLRLDVHIAPDSVALQSA